MSVCPNTNTVNFCSFSFLILFKQRADVCTCILVVLGVTHVSFQKPWVPCHLVLTYDVVHCVILCETPCLGSHNVFMAWRGESVHSFSLAFCCVCCACVWMTQSISITTGMNWQLMKWQILRVYLNATSLWNFDSLILSVTLFIIMLSQQIFSSTFTKSLLHTLQEEYPFLTVFDSVNHFWLDFTMVVYEKYNWKHKQITNTFVSKIILNYTCYIGEGGGKLHWIFFQYTKGWLWYL